MILMGWTLSQWAEVAAWHERAFKMLPKPDLDGARELRHKWMSHRCDEPGGRRIIEVAHEMNFSYATKMFYRVFTQLTDQLRPC